MLEHLAVAQLPTITSGYVTHGLGDVLHSMLCLKEIGGRVRVPAALRYCTLLSRANTRLRQRGTPVILVSLQEHGQHFGRVLIGGMADGSAAQAVPRL